MSQFAEDDGYSRVEGAFKGIIDREELGGTSLRIPRILVGREGAGRGGRREASCSLLNTLRLNTG
ncbi:hypothetical protein E2C01_014857 [Portunus trituberculatus]|uniref:Uncharacterized protein n=1 Tax=Portunus trituberculatus TaxID=210409 RepID=A0A5B7DLE0_PORTR|nr:hypothetical protein [Portunus trituberculatus]